MVRCSGFLPVLGVFAALAWPMAIAHPALAQPAPYVVTITGTEDADLRGLLESASSLVRLKEQPPPSPLGLRRRADDDRDRLDTALRSEGYYDARVAISLTPDDSGKTRVLVTVEPDQPYRFQALEIVPAGGAILPPDLPGPAVLGLPSGAVARAPLVVAAEQKLKEAMAARGYPFAKSAGRRATIDRQARTMDVLYTLAPGPKVLLGRQRFVGLSGVDPALAFGRVGWRGGETYRPELMERTRAALSGLGVFSAVTLEVDAEPAPDGRHDVAITVIERKRHFVGFGASYSNSEGLGGQAYWGHRNLFGGGEVLRFGVELVRLNSNTLTRAGIDDADEKLLAELRKPDFLRVDQALVVQTAAINEHPEGYQRRAVTEQVLLERKLSRQLTVGGGLNGEQSTIIDVKGETFADLAGIPLTLAYDTTDALLDPTAGGRSGVEITPWLRADHGRRSFVVNHLTTTRYHDLGGDGVLVAAGRLSLSTIIAGGAAIPPTDKRIFGGGGGSIRGYGFHKVGPVNEQNVAVGGRSSLEVGVEVRVKITENLGVVPFIDAGNVYSAMLPEANQPLLVGSGLGVRYYTPFGPLRLDVGMPVPKRRHDDPVQVYISLGQAF